MRWFDYIYQPMSARPKQAKTPMRSVEPTDDGGNVRAHRSEVSL